MSELRQEKWISIVQRSRYLRVIQELVRMGTDIEHAEVVVRADGTVFVVDDDGQSSPDLSDAYPSVWHYLLEVAEHTRGVS
jgi:hypothetical protein